MGENRKPDVRRCEMKDITKKQFDAYEAVRDSGVTNMFNIKIVKELSGLDQDVIFTIMENYNSLREKFSKK